MRKSAKKVRSYNLGEHPGKDKEGSLNIVDVNLLKSPRVVVAFVHFNDIKVALGVDYKSNTCDEGQDDIPKKSSDASSRCEVSKSSIKQEEILEKWEKSTSPMRNSTNFCQSV